RVDHHRQRDRRLIGVARVDPLDLRDRHPDWQSDLIGGDSGTVGGAPGLDQIVDQLLEFGGADLLGFDVAGGAPKRWVADHDYLTGAHRIDCTRLRARAWGGAGHVLRRRRARARTRWVADPDYLTGAHRIDGTRLRARAWGGAGHVLRRRRPPARSPH